MIRTRRSIKKSLRNNKGEKKIMACENNMRNSKSDMNKIRDEILNNLFSCGEELFLGSGLIQYLRENLIIKEDNLILKKTFLTTSHET